VKAKVNIKAKPNPKQKYSSQIKITSFANLQLASIYIITFLKLILGIATL